MRSSSEVQVPSTRLPPEENGEMAELCAPITMLLKIISGFILVAAASAGTRGNSAGQTTPSVLEKKLMIDPIMLNATGTTKTGRLDPAQEAIKSSVPASMATLISIPTPQIIIMVFQGTFLITSDCGASFKNNAIAEKTIAVSPTSILLLINLIAADAGKIMCRMGITGQLQS